MLFREGMTAMKIMAEEANLLMNQATYYARGAAKSTVIFVGGTVLQYSTKKISS